MKAKFEFHLNKNGYLSCKLKIEEGINFKNLLPKEKLEKIIKEIKERINNKWNTEKKSNYSWMFSKENRGVSELTIEWLLTDTFLYTEGYISEYKLSPEDIEIREDKIKDVLEEIKRVYEKYIPKEIEVKKEFIL